VIAAFGFAMPGHADVDIDFHDVLTYSDLGEDLDDAPGFVSEPDNETNWKVSLGIIGGTRPDYEGSDDYELAWAPDIKVSWRGIIVIRGKSGRVVYRNGDFKGGLLIRAEGGRDDDDNKALKGLGDVDSGMSIGTFMEYDISDRLTAKGEFRHEVGIGHGGGIVELGLHLGFPLDKKPWIKGHIGTTIATGEYMDEFFSIDAGQAAASGYTTYDADWGPKNFESSLMVGYDITESWVVGGMVLYSRLVGDAADSPIVDKKGSPNQFTAGISLGYQF
jgi:outer membrane scaffolding protein for murein synthesis (MipA/OmpV family)